MIMARNTKLTWRHWWCSGNFDRHMRLCYLSICMLQQYHISYLTLRWWSTSWLSKLKHLQNIHWLHGKWLDSTAYVRPRRGWKQVDDEIDADFAHLTEVLIESSRSVLLNLG